jgi:ribosomal protein S18 acetylase RimI-like enzyme
MTGTLEVTVRPGRREDAQACGAVCHEAYRAVSDAHGFPPDFPSLEGAVGALDWLLQDPAVYSVVAEVDGQIVGSSFLYERDEVVGIGPVTVAPHRQDLAIGRRLLDDVLNRVARRPAPGVRLVQAAFNSRSLSLYMKQGFDVREPLACLQGLPPGRPLPGAVVRKAGPRDLDACNRVCRHVHGHHRGGELLIAMAKGALSVVERERRITGYATPVGLFGHAVGETNDDLKALIASARHFPGSGFLLPTRNGELFRWCLQQGLRVVQPMTLMSRGFYQEPQGAFLPSALF